MATETLAKTPDLEVIKGKDLKLNPADAVFLIDSDKAILFQKQDGANTVKPLGMLGYDDFIKFISQNSIRTDKLPKNCIEYISKDTAAGRTSVFVVEIPPSFYSISLNMKRNSVHTEWDKTFQPTKSNTETEFNKTYNLPMPYITFFVRVVTSNGLFVLNDIRVFASTASARNDKNPMMCHLPVNNLYEDGRICWGQNQIDGKAVTAAAKCDEMINLFFNSPFNEHIPPIYVPKDLTDIPHFNSNGSYINPGVAMSHMLYTQWEKTMTPDPLKMLLLKYRGVDTYNNMLNMMVK